MNEHLLQHIWLHRLYDANSLITEDKQTLLVLDPGQYNRNQGPDFLHARIKLNHIELIGSIEIHLKTSDWHLHQHSGDKHYQNVILHVVGEHDQDFDPGIPVLSLNGRISKILLEQYKGLINTTGGIPCSAQLSKVSSLVMTQWMERMLMERLLYKSSRIDAMLEQKRGDREAVFWWLVFRNMGMPVNADAFERVFLSVPFSLWKKVSDRIQVVEALLLGQSGLLLETKDDHYLMLLKKEYHYLQRKFRVEAPQLLLANLRMRPAHFPVVRLAQLAMLLVEKRNLYHCILQETDLKKIRTLFQVTANDFWHRHYSVCTATVFREKQLGLQMMDNLLINSVLPFRFRMAVHQKDWSTQEWIMETMRQVNKEKNHILRHWEKTGAACTNAADSQSLLHLYRHYCEPRKCLSCAVGAAILNLK